MNIFQLAPNDQAVYYLGQLFGNVGSALTGGGPVLLGTMFKTLNTALLVVAAFFVTFTTVVGVVKTSQEGEFLGKKWDSLWVPLRILLGVAALFPTKSGYCAIQVIVMWCIIQGVGAADMVWKTAIDYFGKGGASTTKAPTPSDLTGTIPTLMKNILASAVCQATVVKLAPGNNNPSLVAHATVARDEEGHTKYQFGRPESPEECGTVIIKGDAESGMREAQATALQTIIPVLESLANQYVNLVIEDKSCWYQGQCGGQESMMPCRYFEKYATFIGGQQPGRCNLVTRPAEAAQRLISYAGSNFMLDAVKLFTGYANNFAINNALKPQNNPSNTSGTTDNLVDKPYEKAQANGWFFAGAYYYYIAVHANAGAADINSFASTIIVDNDEVKKRFQEQSSSYPDYQSGTYPDNAPKVLYCGQYKNNQPCVSPEGGALGLGQAAITAMTDSVAAGQGVATSQDKRGIKIRFTASDPVTAVISYIVGNMVQSFYANIAPQHDDTDNPLVRMQGFGHGLLDAATQTFTVLVALVIGFGAATADIVAFGTTLNPLTGFFGSLVTLVLSLGGAILAYMVTIGGLLGVYVPLLPYILFTFGVVGWMLAVIDAMVAAPFVALGILSPGGQHEILSRAEPSLNLLLSVVSRPVLMVFGMMSAMLLSYLVVKFINAGFYSVFAAVTGREIGWIEALLFIMAYAGLIITALNKCFSLIHLLPEKVLRWIGGHAEAYGEGEAAEQVKGKTAAGGEVASSAGKGAAGTASKAIGEVQADARRDPGKYKKDDEIG